MFRKFAFTTLLLTSASLQGQAPPPGTQDFVFFNHTTAGVRIAPQAVNDELLQQARAALRLSDIQVAALKTLLTMRRTSMEQTVQSMQESQRRLEELTSQTSPGAAEIGQAFLAVRNIQDQMQAAGEKFRSDFKAILNADQRASLDRLQAAVEQARGLHELGILEGGAIPVLGMPFADTAPVGAIGFQYRLSKDH